MLVKEFNFANIAGYKLAALLKKEFFHGHFSSNLSIDSFSKIIDRLF